MSAYQSFLREATLVMQEGLPISREAIRNGKLFAGVLMDKAKEILGGDIELLADDFGLRLYIMEAFGDKYLSYFQDDFGTIILDSNHALLLYYRLIEDNHERVEQAKGLVYYLTSLQFNEECETIIKPSSGGVIRPTYAMNVNSFRWKRCPYIFRKYTLNMAYLDGYNPYYIEVPLTAHISYLMYHGSTFEEAKDLLRGMDRGIFYTFLPIEVEGQLMEDILTGRFDPNLMDGAYVQNYMKDLSDVTADYGFSDMFNVYAQIVKPIMIDIVGLAISLVESDRITNPDLRKDDIITCHLSPSRVGLMVREGVDMDMLKVTKHLQTIEKYSHEKIFTGEFL